MITVLVTKERVETFMKICCWDISVSILPVVGASVRRVKEHCFWQGEEGGGTNINIDIFLTIFPSWVLFKQCSVNILDVECLYN